MNSPDPVHDPSPLPSAASAATATAASTVIGYGAMLLAQKYRVPIDVVGAVLGLAFTGLTALWHRLVPSKAP